MKKILQTMNKITLCQKSMLLIASVSIIFGFFQALNGNPFIAMLNLMFSRACIIHSDVLNRHS